MSPESLIYNHKQDDDDLHDLVLNLEQTNEPTSPLFSLTLEGLFTPYTWSGIYCYTGYSISQCVVPENVHTSPTEGIGTSCWWGGEGLKGQKSLRKCIKFNSNFQRGGGGLENIPYMGKV